VRSAWAASGSLHIDSMSNGAVTFSADSLSMAANGGNAKGTFALTLRVTLPQGNDTLRL